MEEIQNHQYYQGYIAGYRDGMNAAANGKATEIKDNDIASLPIKMMALSTRAYNCLFRAGCTYVADVAALNDYTIATMHNLGKKTAAEIAQWLHTHGILCSAWSEYL